MNGFIRRIQNQSAVLISNFPNKSLGQKCKTGFFVSLGSWVLARHSIISPTKIDLRHSYIYCANTENFVFVNRSVWVTPQYDTLNCDRITKWTLRRAVLLCNEGVHCNNISL